ncbi:MAG TPA: hypothetical protein VGP06_16650 [Janthinobacterium sp.]|jgi:hypothetical protein|nr:hypothetical protein [Janthinobacterium sp.]
METIKGSYTRRVGGATFDYEIDYTPGPEVEWLARVWQDGQEKGEPRGSLTDNELEGASLRGYLVSYVEGMIERGLDVAE